ncbi:hypothetical protein XENTR_v10021312 [Xenopus tropicalis]|nr:hypothetical protein XENTR_v10021312 [Xenopus tropicalis]
MQIAQRPEICILSCQTRHAASTDWEPSMIYVMSPSLENLLSMQKYMQSGSSQETGRLTWKAALTLRMELSDGDLLRFQEKSDVSPCQSSSPDTYFLFQRVRVRPLDFSAITSPRARSSFPGFTPVLATQRLSGGRGGSPHYTTGATVILNSIGSISKMKRERMQGIGLMGGAVELTKPSTPDLPLPSRTGVERRHSRRKAQHQVLCELEEDEEDGQVEVGEMKKRKRGRRKEERKMVNHEQTGRKPRGRPRKHPIPPSVVSQTVSNAEPCAWRSCCLPQEETVSWVQCDHCDSWYHVVCIGRSLTSLQDTDFHCGCT